MPKLPAAFFRLTRSSGESNSQFATRFQSWATRLEAVITSELRRETERTYDDANKTYRDGIINHLIQVREVRVLQAAFDDRLDQLRQALQQAEVDNDEELTAQIQQAIADHGDRPVEPTTPTKPTRPEDVSFSFPKILLGTLYLGGCGLSVETTNSVIRNCKGRTELSEIIHMLRSTEYSQQPRSSQQHGRP